MQPLVFPVLQLLLEHHLCLILRIAKQVSRVANRDYVCGEDVRVAEQMVEQLRPR
jgi:hypothetical protein